MSMVDDVILRCRRSADSGRAIVYLSPKDYWSFCAAYLAEVSAGSREPVKTDCLVEIDRNDGDVATEIGYAR
jgi:hypothetical protein